MKHVAALLLAAGLASGCTQYGAGGETAAASASEPAAVADLRTAAGAMVGTATATQAGGELRVTVQATGVAPGPHGAHVHTIGKCDAPDFTTAGGHWNPAGKQHGSMNPAGPHAGDLPNLQVGSDGAATLTFALAGGTLDGLLDADGSAFVIHAGQDDLKSDPAGNSGARIACGVFARREG